MPRTPDQPSAWVQTLVYPRRLDVAFCPDPNPIEQAFSELKARQRRIGAGPCDGLIAAIGDVCALFDPSECWNFFRSILPGPVAST